MLRLIVTAVLSIASSASGAPLMFPVPTGAIEPEHVVVVPGVSEQDHFWLKEKYPATSALSHYKKVLADWRYCPAREGGWQSFGDQSPAQHVHQQMHHWVNIADDTVVVLGLRYTSEGVKYRAAPETDRQFVVLIRVKQKGASKSVAQMGGACGKDS